MPVITYAIIALTCITSLLAFQNSSLKSNSLFIPYIIKRNNKEWHRFFTHALVHADSMHLIFNMLSLYWFGQVTELAFYELFGHGKGMLFYVLLYVGGVVLSSFPSFEKHKDDSYYGALGASGAVSSVVFSAILIFPTMGMGLLFLPIRMPAFVFGLIYLTASSYLAKHGRDNIGHSAHFWGGVFGIVFTLALKFHLGSDFIQQVKEYINFHLYGVQDI